VAARMPCTLGAHPECRHQLLDTGHPDTLRRGTGWLPPNRQQGGANVIHMRQWTEPPEYACKRCVKFLADGGVPGQGSLLG
jgi:hypothetical protein